MNQSVATAPRRHLIELGGRVEQQRALIEQLESGNRGAVDATRTLRILQDALARTREHRCFVLRDEPEVCQTVGVAAE
jgi:hypothetical protein